MLGVLGGWRQVALQKKFRIRKVLPQLILNEKTFSPKKLRDAILLDFNVERTPEAITMWLKRHSQIVEKLKLEIGEIDRQHENIRFGMAYWFNDFHSKISIVQEWIDIQIARKVSKSVIRQRVQQLRKICMGEKGKDGHAEKIIDWKIHPLALTEEKALQFIVEYNRRGYADHRVRIVVRSFLMYGRGQQPKKISGEKVFGKYGHIFAPKPEIDQILNWLTKRDYLIGTFCKFMYKTATRAIATKTAKLGNLNEEEKTIVVYDKGRKRQKQKWTKYLDDELFHALKPLIDKGKLFERVDIVKARNLCKKAYKLFIPELASEIPMPLHFWRHMFAQHMLRATNWNYTLVAMLGGWKDEPTLKINYGIPPQQIVRKWGLKYVPMI